MFTFSVDKARIDNAARELARLYGKSLQDVLKSQSRLFVRDCVKFTPPMTYGAEYSESWAKQKKIGDNAVKTQVGMSFQDIRDLKVWEGAEEKGEISHSLRKAVRTQNLEAIRTILGRLGVNRNQGVRLDAGIGLHQKMRGRTGRVKAGRPWVILNARSIRTVERIRLAMVGNAKSGWMKAARGLGLALPQWIAKGGKGIYEAHLAGEKPYIIMGNPVPYIQSTGAELRIIARAMKNRVKLIEKEVVKAHQAVMRKRMRG